jgi:hypothetical protein
MKRAHTHKHTYIANYQHAGKQHKSVLSGVGMSCAGSSSVMCAAAALHYVVSACAIRIRD